ncbi:hypothetical protein JNUCC42_15620 [Brevibacterium sp. JNUCC-42]|nr:hypothetical protein JNUCC42_15620 [Brevibacterium sp. JNUCC-42]
MYFSECRTDEELFQAIEKYIWFYNLERFQKKPKQPVCPGRIPEYTRCLGFFNAVYLTEVSSDLSQLFCL